MGRIRRGKKRFKSKPKSSRRPNYNPLKKGNSVQIFGYTHINQVFISFFLMNNIIICHSLFNQILRVHHHEYAFETLTDNV